MRLVKNRERVVTTRELFDALWPHQAVGQTSFTEAIRGARRALGDAGESQSTIRTVRGRGYRLVACARDRDASLEAIRLRLEGLSCDLAMLRQEVDLALEATFEREPSKVRDEVRSSQVIAD